METEYVGEQGCKSVGSRPALYIFVVCTFFMVWGLQDDHKSIRQDLEYIRQSLEQYLVEPVQAEPVDDVNR